MTSMDFTVYTVGDEVRTTSGYLPDLPEGARVHMVTTDWNAALRKRGDLQGQGYRFTGRGQSRAQLGGPP